MIKARVLVTLDSMRYPNTGLYSFGNSLGKALLKHNNDRFELDYFVYPGVHNFDGDNVFKTYYKKYNKLFFINKNKVNLFHFTDQLSRLKPKKVHNCKKILTIHDINQVHENLSAQKLKGYLKKLEERIDQCDRIITISNFTADSVLHYFPNIADKLSVIYNGADKLVLKPNHMPAYIPQKPFLFTIGIVSAKKNFHVLPALLSGNNYELIIAGIKTPYEAEIIEQAKKFGCQDRVNIIGPISDNDRAWYYKNCEAFVFPSIAEGFGLPVIEAMHLGKPVFCSNRTSLPEIGGNAAYYFESFDCEAMQQTFNDGLANFKQNDREKEIKAYAAKYSWDNTAQQYLNLYQKVLEE
jgi:glycosyltransferase involved in cell wall biosynthesis